MIRCKNSQAVGRRELAFIIGLLCLAAANAATAQTDESDAAKDAAAAASSAPAPSAGDVAPPAGVELMKVKGRAVSGIESDVPESVTQFDAATIDALGAANIADLAKVTPNVEIRSAGATTATFFIRGVGLSDFSSNAAGAVGIYQDDIQLNAPAIQLGGLFDTGNVDVKRGPQGYGLFRNSSAGAIRVFAQKPTGEYEARVKTSLGKFWTDDARDAFQMETEGAMNVPLVEDVLAARIAFRVMQSDPHIRNGCGGAPPLSERVPVVDSSDQAREAASICGETPVLGSVSDIAPGLDKWIGMEKRWAARGQLRLSPPDSDADILLNVHGSRLRMDSTVGEFIGTLLVPVEGTTTGEQISRFGAKSLSSNYQPQEQREEFVEIVERISGFTVEEIEGSADIPDLPVEEKRRFQREAYEILGKNLAEDRVLDKEPYRGDYSKVGMTTLDTVGGFLRGEFPIGGEVDAKLTIGTEHYERFRDSDNDFNPTRAFESVTTDRAKQVTFDSEFSGDAFDGAVRWKIGNAYLFERLTNESYVDVGTSATGGSVRRRFVQNTSAFITSAEMAWDFLQDFTIELGGRWNYETKDFRIQERLALSFGELDRQRQKTWQDPTGSISLRYHLTDFISIYSKYSRGFKVGHFNGNNGQEIQDPGPAKPETIDAFEWGFTAAFFDRRIKTGGSFFFYKYNNYQVFIFRDDPNSQPALVIRNAEEVQQFGAEVDLTIEPLKEFVADEFDDLQFVVRFGWLDSEFLEFTNVVFRQDTQTLRQFPLTIDYGGNPLINSPEFKVSGSVQWPLDLEEWGTLTPRYDFDWSDDIFFDATAGRGSLDSAGRVIQPKYALGQPARIIHNVSLAYRTPVGNVEVRGWVRNILDERYKSFAFDATVFAGQVLNFVADPRSAGADVTVTW